MKFNKNIRLVMAGDSVTDCGREKPVGEGRKGGLGTGYVQFLDALIEASYPDHNIRISNVGISGNTSADLRERFETDVMALNPDWVSIMIGINDIWRKLDTPTMTERHLTMEQYQENMQVMCRRVKESGANLILITPFFVESEKTDAMRSMTDDYGEVVKALAAEYHAVLVDTQTAIDAYLQYNHSSAMTWDRVHPNSTGHMIIAKETFKAVGGVF